jgi:cell division GTPase FtsZ
VQLCAAEQRSDQRFGRIPLLNDNKITGAKNVLLLIVSGSNEITLDEIGEINHIQTEAGFKQHMGVGEDETLVMHCSNYYCNRF